MRQELSSLDMHFLTKEFKELAGSKIDKTHQRKNDFVLSLHQPGKGKSYLRAVLPGFLFISKEKEEYAESEPFAVNLRKHICNTRVIDASQKGFERIIDLALEGKDGIYHLIFELFRPGNIILCKEDYKIIMAYDYKGFGSRVVRPGIEYTYPKKEYNFLEIGELELAKVLQESTKNSVVITLAVDLGLGGLFAEEICEISGTDKKKQRLDNSEQKRIASAIEKIRNHGIEACIYYKDNSVADVTPFPLFTYKDLRCEKAESFNYAISSVLSSALRNEMKSGHLSKVEQEKRRLEKIAAMQESQIIGLEQSSEENQKKGEAIYENYPALSHIIGEINGKLKEHSLQEIKAMLKDKRFIEINEKDKKVTVDLDKLRL